VPPLKGGTFRFADGPKAARQRSCALPNRVSRVRPNLQ
jgi:hypothetical protein